MDILTLLAMAFADPKQKPNITSKAIILEQNKKQRPPSTCRRNRLSHFQDDMAFLEMQARMQLKEL